MFRSLSLDNFIWEAACRAQCDLSLFLFIPRIRDSHPVSRPCAKHELRELRNNAIFHTHCTYYKLSVFPFQPCFPFFHACTTSLEHGIMRSLPGLYKDCIVGIKWINGFSDSSANVMRLKISDMTNMGMFMGLKKLTKILNFFSLLETRLAQGINFVSTTN